METEVAIGQCLTQFVQNVVSLVKYRSNLQKVDRFTAKHATNQNQDSKFINVLKNQLIIPFSTNSKILSTVSALQILSLNLDA